MSRPSRGVVAGPRRLQPDSHIQNGVAVMVGQGLDRSGRAARVSDAMEQGSDCGGGGFGHEQARGRDVVQTAERIKAGRRFCGSGRAKSRT